ncbi:MAG TPA: glucokinase [Anaerolineae bacterium]|nr:glucokinase [Anaerolineae bacterium]
MLIAGDIGGTKTNLAIYSPESGLTPRTEATYRSTDYPSLEAVVTDFLGRTGVPVEQAVFGVPGPVVDGQSTATNLPWVIREAEIREALGVEKAKLLNDLEATAYGVPNLPISDLSAINEASPGSGTKIVVAPGTGLGEAILFFRDEHYHVIPSEGGHTDFAPTNLFEIRLLRHLMGKFGHVSYERVCSGSGVPNIYAYLKKQGFAVERPEMRKALKQAADPTPIIVQKAMAGECELSIATLNAFVSILGSEAGNLALKVVATGGVYLGGGIPPKILSKLRDGTFMAAFVNKGRFAEMLARIPVYVILNEKTALFGAACYGLGF